MAITISSIRTLSVLFLALLSSSSVDAHPTRNFQHTDLSAYHVPLSNGSASLSPPHPSLKLKAITIGRGTQNYTCQPNSTDAPTPAGAVADLVDVSILLTFLPISSGQELANDLSSYLINVDTSAIESSPFIHKLGHHYFDAAGVPTFDLGPVGLFKGKRDNGIAAPADAPKGPQGKGDGAVDWLVLCAVEGSRKLKKAYRVETAGGKAPKSCVGQPAHIQVPYAAAYWFYG